MPIVDIDFVHGEKVALDLLKTLAARLEDARLGLYVATGYLNGMYVYAITAQNPDSRLWSFEAWCFAIEPGQEEENATRQ